jgi:hypothetical protein
MSFAGQVLALKTGIEILFLCRIHHQDLISQKYSALTDITSIGRQNAHSEMKECPI